MTGFDHGGPPPRADRRATAPRTPTIGTPASVTPASVTPVSGRRPAVRRAVLLAPALGLVVTACGAAGEFGNDLAKTVISGNTANQSVVETVDPATFAREVPCPPVSVQDGRYIVMRYARGGEDDPTKLLYQANLERWARRCAREADGSVRMTLGVSGRVTPGPAWQGGEILLPIRVRLEGLEDTPPRGRAPAGQVFNVPVTVGAGAPAEQWALVESSFVLPQDRSVKVEIALDDGARGRQ